MKTQEINKLKEFLSLLEENKLNDNIIFRPESFDSQQLSQLIEHLKKYTSFLQNKKIQLNFSKCNLGAEGAKKLADYLQSGKTPKNLTLWLFQNNIGNDGSKHLATAIANGLSPENLYINLDENNITDEGVTYIANALESGKAKSKLVIDFGDNRITDNSITTLAKVLKNAPKGLHLYFDHNEITEKGMEIFAESIQSGKVPVDFGLFFRKEDLGIVPLIKALHSGLAPEGLSYSLVLSNTKINNELGELLAAAVACGKAPKRLHLDLRVNGEINQFITFLTRAFETNNVPEGLHIGFTFSLSAKVTSEKAKVKFIHAISKIRAIHQLKLDIDVLFINDINFQKMLADLLIRKTFVLIDTSIVEPFEKMSKKLEAYRDRVSLATIKNCSCRNELLIKYPQYEKYIKQICYEHGMYKPSPEDPLSLSLSSSELGYLNKESAVDEEKIPLEIHEFIKQLELTKQLITISNLIHEESQVDVPKM